MTVIQSNGCTCSAFLLIVCLLGGCQQTKDVATPPEMPLEGSDSAQPVSLAEEPVDLDVGEQLKQAAAYLALGEKDAARPILEQLAAPTSKLSRDQETKLQRLREQWGEGSALPAETTSGLDTARALVNQGQFDSALKQLDAFLADCSDVEQRRAASELKSQIAGQLAVGREITVAIDSLASADPADVALARDRLWQRSESALPALIAALESKNPVIVQQSLDLLRQRNEPDRTLPAIVAILTRPAQSANWPAAIRELGQSRQTGSGEPLLRLAVESENAEQRIAALKGLSGVVDPPRRTLVALLPLLYQDQPELAAALEAAARSVVVHRQFDLASRRGFDVDLSPLETQQLADLPGRLRSLLEAQSANESQSANETQAANDPQSATPVARAALMLAMATGQAVSPPLPGVRLAGASGESKHGPAEAVLDGVWNATVLTSRNMWLDNSGPGSWIVFDLGQERTVAGVRIWNFNEKFKLELGWRELDVYVSDDQAFTIPVADGIVPQASGQKDAPDYSTLLRLPFVRGRYLKLFARSSWAGQPLSGLSEVQILGF